MPTVMQKIAVQKLVEIGRNAKGQKSITIGRILRESGYSANTAIAPTKVTQSKGFLEEFNKLIPDSRLSEVHNQLLSAATLDQYEMDDKLTDQQIEEIVEQLQGCKLRKILRKSGSATCTVYFYRPDNNARDKALDKGYKLKGHYAPEKQDVNVAVVNLVKYGSKK